MRLRGWLPVAEAEVLQAWIIESKRIRNTIEKCEQRGDIDGLGDLFITQYGEGWQCFPAYFYAARA